jgi:hypothetical protein
VLNLLIGFVLGFAATVAFAIRIVDAARKDGEQRGAMLARNALSVSQGTKHQPYFVNPIAGRSLS